jgi:hypothetical protein
MIRSAMNFKWSANRRAHLTFLLLRKQRAFRAGARVGALLRQSECDDVKLEFAGTDCGEVAE